SFFTPLLSFSSTIRPHLRSTLFPYTTLFRSSLLNIFSDDIYINDDELRKIYDNYLPGLGGLIKNDFDSLMRFRDQIVAFKNDVIDRKSTRLNSSHVAISYAVFCLKKKKQSDC